MNLRAEYETNLLECRFYTYKKPSR